LKYAFAVVAVPPALLSVPPDDSIPSPDCRAMFSDSKYEESNCCPSSCLLILLLPTESCRIRSGPLGNGSPGPDCQGYGSTLREEQCMRVKICVMGGRSQDCSQRSSTCSFGHICHEKENRIYPLDWLFSTTIWLVICAILSWASAHISLP
jgi:hypothetical protein